VALGYADWGQVIFGGGLFSWLAIESVLFGRMLTGPEALSFSMRWTVIGSILLSSDEATPTIDRHQRRPCPPPCHPPPCHPPRCHPPQSCP
jgi:hypothetical protein